MFHRYGICAQGLVIITTRKDAIAHYPVNHGWRLVNIPIPSKESHARGEAGTRLA
jgi:hypothetical protein